MKNRRLIILIIILVILILGLGNFLYAKNVCEKKSETLGQEALAEANDAIKNLPEDQRWAIDFDYKQIKKDAVQRCIRGKFGLR